MKKRNKGFTLVELLVVMAIIAILASIVVPNLATWIGRGRVTKAVSEIESIELSLSAMLADTERSSLNDLYNEDGVRAYLDNVTGSPLPTEQRMLAAQTLYTRATYALLRDGRGALTASDTVLGIPYSQVLDANLVKKLGTNYLPELEFDPWGGLYNIFPGPWDSKNGPIIFRVYQKPDSSGGGLPGKSGAAAADAFTYGNADVSGNVSSSEMYNDPETGIALDIGYPANTRKAFYIWSNGANEKSSQAIYQPPRDPNTVLSVSNPQPYTPDQADLSYDSQLDITQMGGGDDINNWDAGRTWSPFYN
jgi:prepilin-type N-terminal cleavage/methylation domain-containing protein